MLVKNESSSVNNADKNQQNLETIEKLNEPPINNIEANEALVKTEETDIFSRLSVNTKRIIGNTFSNNSFNLC